MRRCILLILGVAGSMLAVCALQVSVQRVVAKEVSAPVQSPKNAMGITLPVPVPGTTLVAQQISAYEGPFLEDGSGKEVVNVAALHIYNTGDREVLNACITLHFGEASYVFYGEHIPPGATVLLLEMQESSYQQVQFTDCTGWQETGEYPFRNEIQINEDENGQLTVTNISQQPLQNICVYYKSWLSPPDIYIGGITHHITVAALQPGRTQVLQPTYYAAGYSKVVSVTAEP